MGDFETHGFNREGRKTVVKHETEHKAPEKIAALSTQQLLSAFETTKFLSYSPELPITRGWLMDELEKRNPAAFNAWLDSEAPEDSNLRRFFHANSICYDCKKMCSGCNGTESNVYTGCIYKEKK